MKSTLILAAALVASVAAAPSYNAPGSNYDAAKPAPAPVQPGYNGDAKPAPGYNAGYKGDAKPTSGYNAGYNGDAKPAPPVTTPCSSAAAVKPTMPANNYPAPAPAPAPTGAYNGVSPDGKKPCTTAVADQAAAPLTTPCEKSAAKTTEAYEQVAPAQPTGAYNAKVQPTGEQNADGSLYQAATSSAGKVGGSVVALMVAGAGLLVL